MTEFDKERRYLVPVAALPIGAEPDVVHLSVYEWLEPFESWATGMSLCGASMRQGPLPDGTTVTCPDCAGWRPKYERMLAPGYRPEDDDPDVLRRRLDEAADALCAETLRRAGRYEDIRDDPDVSKVVQEHVRGELLGMRGALGIVLGGSVPDGSADRLGHAYYQGWLKRREGGE